MKVLGMKNSCLSKIFDGKGGIFVDFLLSLQKTARCQRIRYICF